MPTRPSDHHDAAAGIVAGLDRDTRVRLLSGAGFWHTEAVDGVPSIVLTDGPHGLRKQAGSGDHVGLGDSVPATCFPTAVSLGATWDPDLLEEVGRALGRECRAEDVGVLLGPGLNLKRHPAGGRNFEYLSEDPVVAGRLAGALVRGIQAEGVGACPKHLAVNDQESWRMRVDEVVDPRTLRELELRAFEIAVRESSPWTVMCAYNRVNGEHAAESRWLLTEVLRDQWGFDGLVVSDWFAVADRPAGVAAGLDLEMPSSSGAWDGRVHAALADGSLAEADLDRAATRAVALALGVTAAREELGRPVVDADAHHALARRTAAAGTVLLTNDGLLPLEPRGRIALVGAFAERPRYQGGGSSLVNPTRLDTALDALRARVGSDGEVVYAPGYDPASGSTTPELLAEARAVAAGADAVVVMVGLPTSFESEGFDREHLRLPQGHEDLVQAVLAANPRTAVCLSNGAPVELSWAAQPAALVAGHLGGQASGSALVDVLVGDAEPGGRLAESWPVLAADLPAHRTFATHPTQVLHRETCHVGYRFHDTFDVAPRFPFGHGLSYTTFAYGDLEVIGDGTDLVANVPVTNTGSRRGSTVVQLYVHTPDSVVHRPAQELRAFARVELAPGEEAHVALTLDRRAFAVWDVASADWRVEAGARELRVGASSRDIRATATVEVASDDVVTPVPGPAGAVATDDELAVLLGRPVPTPRPLLPYHPDSTVGDLGQTVAGRAVQAGLRRLAMQQFDVGDDPDLAAMFEAVVDEGPLRMIAMNSGGRLDMDGLDRAIAALNATSPAARRARRG